MFGLTFLFDVSRIKSDVFERYMKGGGEWGAVCTFVDRVLLSSYECSTIGSMYV